MYVGRVVELAEAEQLYEHPRHPYTGALLSAVPKPSSEGVFRRQRIVLTGDVPSPVDPPAACVFHPRCPRMRPEHCDVDPPELRPFEPGHVAACHYPLEHWPMTEDEMRGGPAGAGAAMPFGALGGRSPRTTATGPRRNGYAPALWTRPGVRTRRPGHLVAARLRALG